MAKLTTKQVAAKMRKHLQAAAAGDTVTLTYDDGRQHELRLPPGLRFAVRATKAGVNVTIEDSGYVDHVTDGDRRAFLHDENSKAVEETIREYERFMFGREIGEVKWGDILISVEMRPPRRVGGGEQ